MKVASRLLDVMVDRNLNGKTLEAAGEVDKAIALYEENVSDLFDGNHPYDRLRVIYTKRKQFAEAIRVCRTFVKITDILIQEGSERSYLNPTRDKFMSWIEKDNGRATKDSYPSRDSHDFYNTTPHQETTLWKTKVAIKGFSLCWRVSF
jgi:hypothetical protein